MTSSADPVFESYISSLGIIADGLGTRNTTLTIPGDPVLNGTVVQCHAQVYDKTDNKTLYIQGV